MRKALRQLVLLTICCTLYLYVHVTSVEAATTVTTLSGNATQIPKFQKFEATFQISRTYATDSFLPYYYYDATDTPSSDPGRKSPYAVDGITIDGHFTAPSGKEFIVPAFYYQDFTRSGDTVTPTGTPSWKLRFAPSETGTYQYYITIQDNTGSSRYPTSGAQSFTSSTSSSKGFVTVSPTDSRFMSFSNGESYIPIGSGHQWWKNGRVTDYENAFNNFKTNGINLVRIWDQMDGWSHTNEGHYDGYKYPDDFNPTGKVDIQTLPKGTQINQRGGFEEDKIIESAEKNGVYLELCSHGDAYWIWDAAIYQEDWNPNPAKFADKKHVNYWKRNFRYRVARWGYSTSVLAWETWNEHSHITPNTDLWNFYQTYSQYQRATDPYKHLITTSQGSQAYSPGFWSAAFTDIANYHDYMMSSRYPANLVNDEANFVYRFAYCLGNNGKQYCDGLGLGDGTTWQGANKPWIWGELDVGTTVWNEVNPKAKQGEPRIRMLHNTMWAGLFSPMGTTPLDWYWDQEDAATTTARYADRKPASAFFSGLDYHKAKFEYIMSANDKPPGYTGETITASDPKARVYAMRRADKKAAYLWIQHRDYTWNNAPATPQAISPKITISNLSTTTYRVEQWNTHTGTKTTIANATGPTININLTNITNDTAIKIEDTNATPNPTTNPTPTPIPTQQHCQPLGDMSDYPNCKGSVNSLDLSYLLSKFSSTDFKANLDDQGTVNSLDLGTLLSNLGK